MEPNAFDLTVSGIALLIGLKGLFNGTIRELFGLAGVATGIFAASSLAPDLAPWLGAHLIRLDSSSALAMVAFLIVLALVWLLFVVLGVAVAKYVTLALPPAVDRLLGLLFATVKVFVILSVIVYALSRIEFVRENSRDYVTGSRLYPKMVETGRLLLRLSPATPVAPAVKTPTPGESNLTRSATAKGAR